MAETTMMVLGRIDERVKVLTDDVAELKQQSAAVSLIVPLVKQNLERVDRHEEQFATLGKRVRIIEDRQLVSATSRKLIVGLITGGAAAGASVATIIQLIAH